MTARVKKNKTKNGISVFSAEQYNYCLWSESNSVILVIHFKIVFFDRDVLSKKGFASRNLTNRDKKIEPLSEVPPKRSFLDVKITIVIV